MVGLSEAAIVLLTRTPASGGKSRLFAALGRAPDPALLEALLLDTLDAVAIPGVARVVAVNPPGGCDAVRAVVPNGVHVVPQRGVDLGARMRAAMEDALAAGARRVSVVGSDLPEIRAAAVQCAFTRLERDPNLVVLGPAADGGYYLVAAARPPDVFEHIPWGTSRVLDATLAAAASRRLRVSFVEPGADVDTPRDLMRVLAGDPSLAHRTRAWAKRHERDVARAAQAEDAGRA